MAIWDGRTQLWSYVVAVQYLFKGHVVVAYGNVLMDWDKVLQYKHFDVGDGTHVHLWHDR